MKADFQLSGSAISQLTNTYEKSSEDTKNSLKEYQTKIEELLGKGWKGAASGEFTNNISEYEQSTQAIIQKIDEHKNVMEQAGAKLGILNSEGKKVGEQMKTANFKGDE